MADINFIEVDAGEIYNMIITALETKVSEPLYPGDERRLFGEAVAAVMVGVFNKLNDDARQSLLRYARGTVLDAIGERVDTPRLEPNKASTVLRFSMSQALGQNVVIPAGTRATPDSTLYFATSRPAVLPAGETHVDVDAEATEGGGAYNGYRPGTVSTLVDLVPYVNRVQNIDTTHGGDDGEPYTEEGDDAYRERIRLASARFSTAGPEAAYKYYALSADPGIRDVRIISDQAAGTVSIVTLMEDGGGPSEDVAARVLEAANDATVRPLGDKVTVEAPTFQEYDLELKYYVTQETEAAAIQTIEGLGGALDQFVGWQGGSIGRDINPDKLRALVLCPNWESETPLAGALRVDVVAPSYAVLDERSVARYSGQAKVTHEVVKE